MNEQQALRETVSNLNLKKNALKKELNSIENAIKALQETCKHNMQDDGHDSHYRYYKCIICGWENKV